jgi:hypothetical protein
MAIRAIDIGWAAGFLEGEGCFAHGGNTFAVTATQVQREPLERLLRLFGGSIGYQDHHNRHNPAHQNVYIWRLCSHRAAGLCLTLYTLMSPKRKLQIESELKKWLPMRKRRPPHAEKCVNGHALSPANVFSVPSRPTAVRCRKCHNDYTKIKNVERRAAKRRALSS